MSHEHEHHDGSHDHHSHAPHIESASLGRMYLGAILINALYIVVEASSGLLLHSVALLSDAGHNLVDVSTLALSYLAYRLGTLPTSPSKTYGYRKAEIVSSFGNALLLMGIAIFLVISGTERLLHPLPIDGIATAIIASIGIAVNFGTAWMFLRAQHSDINARGAYLHLLADGLVSLGVVCSGIALYFTGAYWLDGLMGMIIGIVIFTSGYPLMRQSWNAIVDGVPESVNMGEVTAVLGRHPHVNEYHDLHVWALGTREVAMSVHVVTDTRHMGTLVSELSEILRDRGVQHVTIQAELSDCHFDCHAHH